MTPQIQREVSVDLAPDELWELVSTNDGLASWLGDEVDLDFRPGGHGTVVDDDRTWQVEMDRIVDGHEVAFTWWRTDAPEHRSQVTISFEPGRRAGSGGKIRVTESQLSSGGGGRLCSMTEATTDSIRWSVRCLLLGIRSVGIARLAVR